MATAPDNRQPQKRYDVAILGGGLAGLSLALQLKRARPETSVFVAEKRKGPAPEAAFKVGESTLEIGAHYFGTVLELRDHIERDELPKHGVRFWFSAGDNSDITKRAEYGPPFPSALPTYQLDRGRFENELAARNLGAGVDLFDDCAVQDVELGSDEHAVTVERNGETATIAARWVVDAAGRRALLKRKLGLEKDAPHDINAAWFRLAGGLDIEEWSDDPDWHGRMSQAGLRTLSTNHLIGKGYWVWIIPLASGNASIGIVADPRVHPFERIETLDAALDWLNEHELQIAGILESRRDQVVDFLKVRHYSHGVQRVYSPERWCLTGDAGVFIDPLFSPGSDFIGICNSLITDLILTDLSGQPVAERVEFANDFFLRYFEAWLAHYQDVYLLFDDPALLTLKFSWYRASYFPIPVRLFYAGKFGDVDFLRTIAGELDRFCRLMEPVERLIRDWHALEPLEWDRAGLIKPPEFAAMRERVVPDLVALQDGSSHPDDATLKAQVAEMARLLEASAVVIFHEAVRSLPGHDLDPGARINPYAVSLHPERWEADGLFDGTGLTLAEAAEATEPLGPEVERLTSGEQPVFTAPPTGIPSGPPGI